MSAEIIATYNGIVSGKTLQKIDFNNIKDDSIKVELKIEGRNIHPEKTVIIWEIFSNGMQLDLGDLTMGQQAELLILKTYAGPPEKPHQFKILAKDFDRNVLAELQLEVVAMPEIKDAYWFNTHPYDGVSSRIREASVSDFVGLHIEGTGVFGVPLNIAVYREKEDEKIYEITFTIDDLYNEIGFFINAGAFDKELSFYMYILKTTIWNLNQKLAIIGKISHEYLDKLYFVVSSNRRILYHGGRENNFLNIYFDIESLTKSLLPPPKENTLKPVVIHTEEYFTQKYEPCKYERIYYKYGKEVEIEIFDEKKPTTKNKDGKYKNNSFNVSLIVPPKDSPNIKDMKLRLEGVATKECQYNAIKKKLIKFASPEKEENAKPHTGRVIKTTDIENDKMKVTVEKKDEKVTISPSYPYLYDQKNSWEFLKKYFLFSSLFPESPGPYVWKRDLIDYEVENKNIIRKYTIPVTTCRYKKMVHLNLYPDLAWAFHLFYNDPSEKIHYLENDFYNDGNTKEKIKTQEGIGDWIDKIKDNNQSWSPNFIIPYDPLGIEDKIQDYVLDIISELAKKYEIGFTAYYDFDAKGQKNKQQIDYAEDHPTVTKVFITSIVAAEIILQIVLLFITEGASAEASLAELGKMVKLPGKLGTVAEKAAVRTAERAGSIKTVTKVKKVVDTFTALSFTYYRGYRYVENPDHDIQLLMEERLKFAPICKVEKQVEKTLGELVYHNTKAAKVIDLTKTSLKYLKLGANLAFFKGKTLPKSYKDLKERKAAKKNLEYPITVMEKGVDRIEKMLVSFTDQAIKDIFGAEGSYSVSVSGGLDLDYHLKINNSYHTFQMDNFLSGGNQKDLSEVSIAPSAGISVKIEFSASVKVPVRAINVLNYVRQDNKKLGEAKINGKLEINGNYFFERSFHFHADTRQPYYQDAVIFTGIGGSYEYKIKIKNKKEGDIEDDEIDIDQPTKEFMLIDPFIVTQQPTPFFTDPTQ